MDRALPHAGRRRRRSPCLVGRGREPDIPLCASRSRPRNKKRKVGAGLGPAIGAAGDRAAWSSCCASAGASALSAGRAGTKGGLAGRTSTRFGSKATRQSLPTCFRCRWAARASAAVAGLGRLGGDPWGTAEVSASCVHLLPGRLAATRRSPCQRPAPVTAQGDHVSPGEEASSFPGTAAGHPVPMATRPVPVRAILATIGLVLAT
jgi:hypothetical protein